MPASRLWLTLLLLSASVPATAGTIYKCKNAQGELHYQQEPCKNEQKAVSSWAASSEININTDSSSESNSGTSMTLSRGNFGHFFVDGAINDQFLNFVIDTGASQVTIPQSLANTAKLKCLRQGNMLTGNGVSQVCTTVINKLRFGTFTLHNVDALIAPNLGQPLLGMNVLKRFKVEQDGEQMKLTKNY